MAHFTFTLDDNPDGTVEIKSDQDLPFDHPEQATNAQRLAMYLVKVVTRQLEYRGPKRVPGLILPEHLKGGH